MNRKGFAVTAVIYGLSILGVLIVTILMGTLSSSRNNVSEEAKQIEKELIAFNKSNVVYSTGESFFTVPEGESGWYRVEAYGRSSLGAKGAYVTGIIYLDAGKTLHVSITNDAIIRVGNGSGPIIMRAASAFGNSPGGTLTAQCSEANGGNIDLSTFQLKDMEHINLIGSEGVSYNASSCLGARSSFMVGYPGSFSAETPLTEPSIAVDGFEYYFVDGLMIPAAHDGVAKVSFERLAKKSDEIPTIPRQNKKFDNVRQIQIRNNSGVSITGIYVTSQGRYVYKNETLIPSSNTVHYLDITPSSIDDISILFDVSGNRYIHNVTINLVKESGEVVSVYRSIGDTKGFTVVPTGIKLSAYQPDSFYDLSSHGNYYLIPVVSPNKILSAMRDSESDSNPIGIEPLNGDTRQKWAIDLIAYRNVYVSDRKEYYITESSRYKSISIYRDENLPKNRISASMTFNSLSRNLPQIWQVYPLNDGTFAIKTIVESFYPKNRSGFLTVDTSRNADGLATEYYELAILGIAQNPEAGDDKSTEPTLTERFMLYSLDFSQTNK